MRDLYFPKYERTHENTSMLAVGDKVYVAHGLMLMNWRRSTILRIHDDIYLNELVYEIDDDGVHCAKWTRPYLWKEEELHSIRGKLMTNDMGI